MRLLPCLPRLPRPHRSSTTRSKWQLDVDQRVTGWAADQAAVDKNQGAAAGATLSMMMEDLAAKKHAYVQLEASIEAFRAAHALLAKNVGHLSDSELLTQVVAVVQSAASLVLSMEAPLGSTSNTAAGSTTTTATH